MSKKVRNGILLFLLGLTLSFVAVRYQQSSLRGQLTPLGKIGSMPVELVTFSNGFTSQLQAGKIYLVHVPFFAPNGGIVITKTLDESIAQSFGGPPVAYYGYKYSSTNAVAEINNKGVGALMQQYPGQFFASMKAFTDTALNADITAFVQKGVTFLPTNTAQVTFERESLYMIIVGETVEVRIVADNPPQPPSSFSSAQNFSSASSQTSIATQGTGGSSAASSTANATHKACVNGDCISVAGEGDDECSGLNCTASSSSSSAQTHLACGDNQCLPYSGAGPNTCTTNADCMSSSSSSSAQTHLACGDNQCLPYNGPGANTCTTNADCMSSSSSSMERHLACGDNQCISYSGPGPDTCAVDADCIKHTECRNEQCLLIDGEGEDSCLMGGDDCVLPHGPGVDDSCPGLTPGCSYTACVDQTCTVILGNGESRCDSQSDCTPSSSSSSSSSSIAVCGDFRVDPPEECDNGGVGTSTCGTDCQFITHKTCFLNGTCNEVPGPSYGAATCTMDAECPVCGNGIPESPEECDEGLLFMSSLTCTTSCTRPCTGDATYIYIDNQGWTPQSQTCSPHCIPYSAHLPSGGTPGQVASVMCVR